MRESIFTQYNRGRCGERNGYLKKCSKDSLHSPFSDNMFIVFINLKNIVYVSIIKNTQAQP